MPHSVGPEKSVVSVLLQYPERIKSSSLTDQHFYLPVTRKLFQALVKCADSGQSVDMVSLIDMMGKTGDLDAIGGASAVSDIYSHDLSDGRHFDHHLTILNDSLARRTAIIAARKIEESAFQDEELSDLLELVADTASGIKRIHEASSQSLLERAYAMAFNPESPPPVEETLMAIVGAPVAANGNLTGVQGKSKVGKSSVMSAILGAALRGNFTYHQALKKGYGDCLGFEWSAKNDSGRVIHFDTEQSPADWFGIAMRSIFRGALPAATSRLLSIPLVCFSRRERIEIVRQVIKREHETGGVALVIIDGVADLCASPNDEEEALELVRMLMALCHEYDTAIICVLHENPGSDAGKTRGHLGSELNRKAFANLRIDKEDDMSIIYGEQMRKKDIPKSVGICFKWDDEARMHVTAGSAKQVQAGKIEDEKNAKIEKSREDAAKVFGDESTLEYAVMAVRIMDVKDIKQRAAENRIKAWTFDKIITKNGLGTYTLNP
jgi:hypothetical protein